jgi:hypothetical protein
MTIALGREGFPVNGNGYPLAIVSEANSYNPLDGALVDPEVALGELRAATEAFRNAVETIDPVDVDGQTEISWKQVDEKAYGDASWRPRRVFEYSSVDPYWTANPELTAATNIWISSAMKITSQLKSFYPNNPQLAYVNGKRANGGRRMTLPTQTIAGVDPVLGNWIETLPRAENLRPVANIGAPLLVYDKERGIVKVPTSRALQALTGGSYDGRGVRERGAWESEIVKSIDPASLTEGKLVITSLGTGTGEPAADSGIGLARKYSAQYGPLGVLVHGYDIKESSLKVATHIAEEKARALNGDVKLAFIPHLVQLHRPEELAQAVRDTRANVYEAIGLAEYMASQFATDPAERQIFELMQRVGGVSAEEFYKIVYDNMPEGSIFITGNMTSTSPQGAFVEDGIGWPGLIRRSDEKFLAVLRNTGIPGEAVDLFKPDPENSAASYNLVVIRKMRSKNGLHVVQGGVAQRMAPLAREALKAA